MQVYSVIRKGESHPVFCEDFLLAEMMKNNWLICAVMDGCSSGKDSHFASALTGKLLKKIINSLNKGHDDLAAMELNKTLAADLGKKICKDLFEQLNEINDLLQLEYLELLSTLILLVYHPVKKEAWIMASGDGFVALNENVYEIDQNNRPDYLTYHLQNGFDRWFDNHVNIFQESDVHRISISTDGIGSFFSLKKFTKADFNVANELLTFPVKDRNDLDKKIKQLHSEYDLVPYDDISIIRIENK